ncbi:MAG: hypothetical protein WEG36_06225 [Gemmatimonadota bacterium]
MMKGGASAPQISARARVSAQGIDQCLVPWSQLGGRAEIVILDSFPTTLLLECVQGRIPVMAIVPDGVEFSEAARPYYDEFVRSGILHRTPEAAAEFLNDLNISAWWSEIQGHPWFESYLTTFCRTEVAIERSGG